MSSSAIFERRFIERDMRKDDADIHRREAGAIILKIAYGYTVEPHKADPLVDIADKALAQFSAATVPGAWMVDTIPARAFDCMHIS